MLPCGDVAKGGVGCQHAFWLPLLALHWSLGLRGASGSRSLMGAQVWCQVILTQACERKRASSKSGLGIKWVCSSSWEGQEKSHRREAFRPGSSNKIYRRGRQESSAWRKEEGGDNSFEVLGSLKFSFQAKVVHSCVPTGYIASHWHNELRKGKPQM